MASLKCTLQLLFLGALLAPVYLQHETCLVVQNTIRRGTYRLEVHPEVYKPDATYTGEFTDLQTAQRLFLF